MGLLGYRLGEEFHINRSNREAKFEAHAPICHYQRCPETVPAQDKEFYVTASEEYHIHVILGDRTYYKIRTDQTFKERHIHFKLCKLMTMPVSPF